MSERGSGGRRRNQTRDPYLESTIEFVPRTNVPAATSYTTPSGPGRPPLCQGRLNRHQPHSPSPCGRAGSYAASMAYKAASDVCPGCWDWCRRAAVIELTVSPRASEERVGSVRKK